MAQALPEEDPEALAASDALCSQDGIENRRRLREEPDRIGMKYLELFRRRVGALLTTPPEILYLLTRHWFILTVCVVAAVGFVLQQFMNQATTFEANATLLLNPSDSGIVGPSKAVRANAPNRDEAERFFSSRVAMLQNHSVLRKVVGKLTQADASSQDEADDAYYDPAIESFLARSKVLPDSRTSTIDLKVFGADRQALEKELMVWIESYIDHLVEMGRESRDTVIASRKHYWEERENAAREAIMVFKREHPDVSKAAQDLVLQEVMQLQVLRIDLNRQTGTLKEVPISKVGDAWLGKLERLLPDSRSTSAPMATPPRVDRNLLEDPEVKTLMAKRGAIEAELFEVLPLYSEESQKVQSLRKTLQLVNSRLITRLRELEAQKSEAIVGSSLREGPEQDLREKTDDFLAKLEDLQEKETRDLAESWSALYEKDKKDISEREQKLNTAIVEAMRRYGEMGMHMEKLLGLEDELKQAQQTQRNYELLSLEEADRDESRRNVQVQISDRPHSGLMVDSSSPARRFAKAALMGLALGMFIAGAMETLRSKLRFKNDLMTDFSLRTAGVIPVLRKKRRTKRGQAVAANVTSLLKMAECKDLAVRDLLPTQTRFLSALELAGRNREFIDHIHRLRDTVILSLRDRDRRAGLVLALTGPLGGEGASILNLLLSLSLGECSERRVAILDGQFDLPRFDALTHVFHLSQNAVNLKKSSGDVVGYCNQDFPNVYFLKNSTDQPAIQFFSDKKLSSFFAALRKSFDFTIVNMPPLLRDTTNCFLLPHVDRFYLVTEARATRLTDVRRCIEIVGEADCEVSGAIVNKQRTPYWSRYLWRDFFV